MPQLFVIMPFGAKSDGTQVIDFDAVYRDMIRPAAVSAGWDVGTAREMRAPGPIAGQVIRELMNADLVLADLTTNNANVLYELGIRHSISNNGTILISQTPEAAFYMASQRIIFYNTSPQ